MSHAVKCEIKIKDKALAKKVAAKLSYNVTERQDGSLSLNIHSQYGVPFVIAADGESCSFDKSYDCQTANNAVQRFMQEYSTESLLQSMTLKGYTAMRGQSQVDAHGNVLQTVEVM